MSRPTQTQLRTVPTNNNTSTQTTEGQGGVAVDRRESKRIQFYRGEFPPVSIEFNGRKYQAEVYDLSTNGIGVIPSSEIQGLDFEAHNVSIELESSRPIPARLRKIAHVKYAGSIRLKLGFELETFDHESLAEQVRFDCSANMPLAYCEDPVAFKRTMIFNISAFTHSTMSLRANDHDFGIYQGLKLDLRVMLPARGEFAVIAEVIALTRKDDNIDVTCSLLHSAPEFRNAVSEFLLMTTKDLSVKQLRTAGFKVDDIEKAYFFRYANTEEQFHRILDLRLRAAQRDGRWIGETDIFKMTDEWDRHARHLICELNGKIIAAGRIVYNNGIRTRSEHVSYKVDVPEWLWKQGFVESSRVCTDPEYRGSELFVLMLQQIGRVIAQSGFRYLLMNCADSLVPIYKKTVGVRSLGHRFYTPFMKDKALNLLYLDIRWLHLGFNFNPTTWRLNLPLGSYFISKDKLTLTKREWLLLPFFKALHFSHRMWCAIRPKRKSN